MASPGQKRGTCGHIMALFDSHSKCVRCHEKGLGTDPCVEKMDCEICYSFTSEQKEQLATPTYRTQKEHQKKASSPPLVDPPDVTVLGQVESGKGDTSDRGETPSKKRKSPSKKSTKAGKTADFQSELKNLDDKWSEHFARLEAMFLTRSFTVPVEPVQRGDVVVTDRPFIPLLQQITGVTGQRQPTGQMEMKKATQPVEAPGAVIATRPVEASGATSEFKSSDVVVTDRPFIPLLQQTTGVTGQRQPTGQMEMKKATQPVEAPSTVTATQPVEAPGAVIATRPVEASGATSEFKSSDVVVTDRPFIPLLQQTTGVTGQRQPTGQMEMKKATQPVEAPSTVTATQPVEAPGAVIATRPVEASGATSEFKSRSCQPDLHQW